MKVLQFVTRLDLGGAQEACLDLCASLLARGEEVHPLTADQGELLKWFSTLAPAKPKVILTHGEDSGRGTMAKLIQQRFKLNPLLPKQGDVIEV